MALRSTDDESTPQAGILAHRRLLTSAEEVDLAKRARRGDSRARSLLIESNLRLVGMVARHYATSLLPFEDCVQEGTIGLITACERFDPNLGNRLSTYAVPWIKQAISRAIDERSRMIRIPAHVIGRLRKINRMREDALRTTGTEPGIEKIAHALRMDIEHVRDYLQASAVPTSLDAPRSYQDDDTFGSLLMDESAVDPAERLIREERIEMIHQLIAEVLDDSEQAVLRRRLGLEYRHSSIRPERARQTEARAMKKLRLAARRHTDLLCDADNSLQ